MFTKHLIQLPTYWHGFGATDRQGTTNTCNKFEVIHMTCYSSKHTCNNCCVISVNIAPAIPNHEWNCQINFITKVLIEGNNYDEQDLNTLSHRRKWQKINCFYNWWNKCMKLQIWLKQTMEMYIDIFGNRVILRFTISIMKTRRMVPRDRCQSCITCLHYQGEFAPFVLRFSSFYRIAVLGCHGLVIPDHKSPAWYIWRVWI